MIPAGTESENNTNVIALYSMAASCHPNPYSNKVIDIFIFPGINTEPRTI